MLRILVAVICMLAAPACARAEVYDDRSDPEHNAVVAIGVCTATLITPDVLLTAAHCVPLAWRRAGDPRMSCRGLPDQASLANHPSQGDATWTPVPRGEPPGPGVKFTAARQGPGFYAGLTDYAIAPCADMALLRLEGPIPPRIVLPIPAVTRMPDDPGAWLSSARLRHAGFGTTAEYPRGETWRQTGRTGFWTDNKCHIFAVPPERGTGGPRILHGDSGSPLLVETPDGPRVAGVLFGAGAPDADACGIPVPRLPERHGSYTPTFRPAIEGTDGGDLGAWIETLTTAPR